MDPNCLFSSAERVIHMSNLASIVHAGLKILTVILRLCADVKKKTLRFLEHLLKQRVELRKGRHGNKPGRTADFSDQQLKKTACDWVSFSQKTNPILFL